MVSDKCWLFFDIDGTIAENDAPPSPSLTKCLQTLRQEGHKLFLCTARTRCDVYPSVCEVGFDGIISGAGSHVNVEGRDICCHTIPVILLRIIARIALKRNISMVFEGVDEMYLICGKVSFPWKLPVISSSRDLHPDMRIQKFTMHLTLDQNVGWFNFVLACLFLQCPKEFPEKMFVEYIPRCFPKSYGIRRVMKHYGQTMKKTIAFGDSYNDLDMLKQCAIGVAMGNSPQKLKDVAYLVTDTVDQNGVVQALKKLGLITPGFVS